MGFTSRLRRHDKLCRIVWRNLSKNFVKSSFLVDWSSSLPFLAPFDIKIVGKMYASNGYR